MIGEMLVGIGSEFWGGENKGGKVGMVIWGVVRGIVGWGVVRGFVGEVVGWGEM